MGCGQRLKTIRGNGKGKDVEVAFQGALDDAFGQGQRKCAPGSCPKGQDCRYLFEKVTVVQVMESVPDSGKNRLWFVAIDAEGGCKCIDWDAVPRV